MATDFENFIKVELPLRPIVATNAAEETILVRRGVGPRVYVPLDILEGQVVGKSGGVMQGVSPSGGASYSQVIVAGLTEEVARFSTVGIHSVVLITDIVSVDGLEQSFQIFAKPRTGDIDYNQYMYLGDDIAITVTITRDVDDLVYTVENSHTSNIEVFVRTA